MITACLLLNLLAFLMIFVMVREIFLIKSLTVTPTARIDASGPVTGSNIRNLVGENPVHSHLWDGLLCLIFTTPSCSLCREVSIGKLGSIRKSWSPSHRLLEVIQDQEIPVGADGMIGDFYLSDDLSIRTLPYCLILNKEMDVLAGGLVNSPVQIESLLELSSKRLPPLS